MEAEGVPFGRYQLIGLLGQGGMATVYRGLLSGPMGFEKEVAVKRIHDEAAEDEGLIRSLVNEARLGGSLRHPNIVETYEFNQLDDTYYVALEYVDGWSLDVLLKLCRKVGKPVPVLAVHEIMIQACRGLSHAHNLVTRSGERPNLVHRDLKPGNIMVSRGGAVKLMDFGIAKATTNLYQTTSADVVRGTPVYMSPEQLRAAKLDKRSDIFSMGSVLHELTTLRIPFHAENLVAITYQIVECDVSDCIERVRQRHAPLGPILAKAMAKERDDRYADASELEEALERSAHEVEDRLGLKGWLKLIDGHLPKARAVGDFGRVGPPTPVSLSAAPTVRGQIESSEPTVEERIAGLEDTMDVASVGSAPTRPYPPEGKRRPWLPVAGVGALLGVVGLGFALTREPPPPTPGAEPATLSAAPATPVQEDPPTPEEPPPSDEQVTSEPVRTPAVDPPRASVEPEKPAAAAPVAAKRPEPAPEPEAAPAPEAVELGEVVLHSIPWSYVIIDGVEAGKTLLRTELPVGSHKVVFRCTQCEPDEDIEKTIQVRAGGPPQRTVVKFQ